MSLIFDLINGIHDFHLHSFNLIDQLYFKKTFEYISNNIKSTFHDPPLDAK